MKRGPHCNGWLIEFAPAIAALGLLAGPAIGQCEVDRLLPPQLIEGEGLGTACAIDGQVAVIGARSAGDGAVCGAAHVIRFDGANWDFEARLQPPNLQDGDQFGAAVAIDGDRIVVGAPGHDEAGEDAGSAFVYQFDGMMWVLETQLVAKDGAPMDRFGHAVAVSGDTIAIGSPGHDAADADVGAAYVFHKEGDTWAAQPRLKKLELGKDE